MKITVIGTGYVGLVTGACLAETGNEVLCLDLDQEKIALLKEGVVPIHEPGLAELVHRNYAAGRIDFTTDIRQSVAHGELQCIAVGTPSGQDGAADLQAVVEAARHIGQCMTDYRTIIDKSTVPVGTADVVRKTIREELDKRRAKLDFSVVSNPEFLKEGAAIEDFMRPDRIIIGIDADSKAVEIMRHLYAPFQRNHERLILMSVRSAELCKYAANAMLATRISFMNELALLAEKVGADIEQVRRGIGADPRIGYHFLYAGCGYGGSCFPKDMRSLQYTALQNGMQLKILSAVESVNHQQKKVLLDKITRRFGANLQGKTFALWGLAFKPNTDDMREAPSRTLMEGLWQRGARVCAYDPAAMQEARRLYPDPSQLALAHSPTDALNDADALIIVTEWQEFRSPDFGAVKALLKYPVIFDGRNLYSPEELQEAGFEYFAIGRGP